MTITSKTTYSYYVNWLGIFEIIYKANPVSDWSFWACFSWVIIPHPIPKTAHYNKLCITHTFEQTKKVEKYLHIKSSIENLEEITGEVNHCPNCQSESFHKWGVRSGLQRYRCKTCRRNY